MLKVNWLWSKIDRILMNYRMLCSVILLVSSGIVFGMEADTVLARAGQAGPGGKFQVRGGSVDLHVNVIYGIKEATIGAVLLTKPNESEKKYKNLIAAGKNELINEIDSLMKQNAPLIVFDVRFGTKKSTVYWTPYWTTNENATRITHLQKLSEMLQQEKVAPKIIGQAQDASKSQPTSVIGCFGDDTSNIMDLRGGLINKNITMQESSFIIPWWLLQPALKLGDRLALPLSCNIVDEIGKTPIKDGDESSKNIVLAATIDDNEKYFLVSIGEAKAISEQLSKRRLIAKTLSFSALLGIIYCIIRQLHS